MYLIQSNNTITWSFWNFSNTYEKNNKTEISICIISNQENCAINGLINIYTYINRFIIYSHDINWLKVSHI